MPEQECPNATNHTPSPQSYVGRQEWARAMVRAGFRQFRCPGCGLWAIWRGIGEPIPHDAYEGGCLTGRPRR